MKECYSMKSKGIWFLLTGILIGGILVLLIVLFNGTWNHNNNMDQDHMMGNDSATGQMDDHMMGDNGMGGNNGPMGHGAMQELQASDEPTQPLPIPTALQPDRVSRETRSTIRWKQLKARHNFSKTARNRKRSAIMETYSDQ